MRNPTYNQLKKMFPHILFHADRVKAYDTREWVVNRAANTQFDSFLSGWNPEPSPFTLVECASWDDYTEGK